MLVAQESWISGRRSIRDHPGHRVDPDKMIFDGLDPGDIFRGRANRPALPLIQQRARKAHDPVADHDIDESDRGPPLNLEFRINPLANRRIARQPWLRLGYDARQRMQEIRARFDTDKLTIAHHEYTIDLVAFHKVHDLIEPTVFRYRSHVRGHHVADLAAGRLQILCGQASWTHQKFDPTPALPLCPRFRPPDEIPLCYDPNQSAACIHDRQAAEFALQHQPDGVGDRSVRGNTHGIRGHDVSGPHGVSSSFDSHSYLSAGARPLYDGKNFERRGPYAHASYQSARISPISIAISAAATAGLPRMCVPPPCVAMHLETSPRRPRIYSFMQCARNRADGPDRRAVWSASGHSQIAAFFAARSGHS